MATLVPAWRVRPGPWRTPLTRILLTISPQRLKRSATLWAASWVDRRGRSTAVLFLRCGTVLEAHAHTGPARWARGAGTGLPGDQRIRGREARRSHHAGCTRSLREGLRQVEGNQTAVLLPSRPPSRGAAATAQMKPRVGRSSYLGDRVLGHPDPGAKAISLWLRCVRTIVCDLPFTERNRQRRQAA